MEAMNNWTFPAKTCEIPRIDSIIHQPWSCALNVIGAIILASYAIRAKRWPQKIAVGSYSLFELYHAATHAKHLGGSIQTTVVHGMGYMFWTTTFMSIKDLTAVDPSFGTVALYVSMITADLCIFVNVGGLWNVLSGFTMFLVLFLTFWHAMPLFFKRRMRIMIAGLFLLASLFVNEAFNCSEMLRFAELPYHAIIEILGVSLFAAIGYSLVEWENSVIQKTLSSLDVIKVD